MHGNSLSRRRFLHLLGAGGAASPHVAVAALCDIDDTEKHMGRAAEKYPAS